MTNKELIAKVERLQGEKRVIDYVTPEMGFDGFFPEEVTEMLHKISLADFVTMLRDNAYETNPAKKVGYINAVAGAIGIPTGPDNVWIMPDASWEPNSI